MQLGISLYTSVDKALTFHTMDKAKEKGMHIETAEKVLI